MARPLKEDLTGKRFGRLFVVRREGSGQGQALWFCRCDCGKECVKPGSHMRRGNTKSCGCWRHEFSGATKTTHGMSAGKGRRSKIYGVWAGMKNRCHNPNQPHYPRYGGMGIKVCAEWLNSFEAFYRDMGEPPKDGQRWTLDRIDVFKGYEPGNVRWALKSEQCNNTRSNVHLTLRGETLTIAQWAVRQGLPYGCLQQRVVKLKWSHEKALTTPLMNSKF